MELNNITRSVIGSAINVHKELGPGLLEKVYEECLAEELMETNLNFRTQLGLPVTYKNKKLNLGYRADFVVEDKVIIEIKSIESIHPVYEAQILTYMKLSKCKIGLLMNFNVNKMTNGIKRFIL